ncbi:MAG: hypothetical protein Q7U98_17235 [Methylicorpusculum sp.]|uniref:hypothetical protein n=1 Tax=Methylicorpusculum sp. TaxID=2713644 RepID=UPI002724A607|nr:hypothetical protein [Methylicorpusculum sp.]MDO8940901.1 hypothetical protein [Methylicorpusculum sp.]MDP2202408.1 hypothetical protein [Methylicorpusculum sp.]
MITLQLDLGTVPSVLAAVNDPLTVRRVVNAAAESYVDDLHDWIDAGQGFTPRTGILQQSINWRPLGNGAEIYANAEYAGWVEEGTAAHVIRPKDRKALRFPVSGGAGFGFAKEINHPGSKAHPFFFADVANREERMQARALSVLARVLNG